MIFDAEVVGQRGGIIATVLAGNGGGQGDTDHVFRAKCFGRDGGDYCGIDATAQPDECLFEAALVRIVAESQYQRIVGGGIAFEIKIRRDVVLCGRVQIDCAVFGAEGGEPSDQAALRMRHQAASVENQLIIAADRVAIYNRAVAAIRGLLHQRFTRLVFAFMPRAGGQVEQQVNAPILQ